MSDQQTPGEKLHAALTAVVMHLSEAGLERVAIADGIMLYGALWESTLLGKRGFAQRLRDLADKFENDARAAH